MKTLYKKRLLKLARHLESGKLGHEHFNFACVNADDRGYELTENGCGSQGCALGELPFVFPSLWEFKDGQPKLKGVRVVERDRKRVFLYADKFFQIKWDETNRLFSPTCGGLSYSSTPLEVAANIRAFVKRKEQA